MPVHELPGADVAEDGSLSVKLQPFETLPVPVAEAVRTHAAGSRSTCARRSALRHTTAQVPSLLHGMARHAASRKTLEPVEAAVLRAFLGADAL